MSNKGAALLERAGGTDQNDCPCKDKESHSTGDWISCICLNCNRADQGYSPCRNDCANGTCLKKLAV